MKIFLNYFLTLKEKKLEPHWIFQQFFLFILGERSIITPTVKLIILLGSHDLITLFH